MESKFSGGLMIDWFTWLWHYDRNRVYKLYMTDATRQSISKLKPSHLLKGRKRPEAEHLMIYMVYSAIMCSHGEQSCLSEKMEADYYTAVRDLESKKMN